MSRNPLWGFDGTLDFWTALERGEVEGPEEKAVNLLRRVCDQERFDFYCQTGQLPIMGNVTKRIYLALKAGGLLELEDGVPVAWWCFSIGPYAPDIPDTDHVVSVRTIVEGEELAMFHTGDRHEGGYHFLKHKIARALGVCDPFVEDFLPVGSARPDRELKTFELLDIDDYAAKNSKDYAQFVWAPNQPMAPGLEDLQYPPFRQQVGFGQNAFPILGQDVPYPPNFQMPPLLQEGNIVNGNNYPAPPIVWAHDPNNPLVRRAPMLPAGLGIDMHDGTILHIDEDQAREVERRCGFRIDDEIERMLNEGYTPELIEYTVNHILPNARLGDPRGELLLAHAGAGNANNNLDGL